MKDIRSALRALLLADAAINAAVTTSPTIKRIYPGILPQVGAGFQPTIVHNLITEDSDLHMQGPSGLGTARVQVDCWALLPDDAVALANLVMDHLSGFKGTVAFGTESPQQTIEVKGIFHDTGRDDYEPIGKLYTRRRDYNIWYWET